MKSLRGKRHWSFIWETQRVTIIQSWMFLGTLISKSYFSNGGSLLEIVLKLNSTIFWLDIFKCTFLWSERTVPSCGVIPTPARKWRSGDTRKHTWNEKLEKATFETKIIHVRVEANVFRQFFPIPLVGRLWGANGTIDFHHHSSTYALPLYQIWALLALRKVLENKPRKKLDMFS